VRILVWINRSLRGQVSHVNGHAPTLSNAYFTIKVLSITLKAFCATFMPHQRAFCNRRRGPRIDHYNGHDDFSETLTTSIAQICPRSWTRAGAEAAAGGACERCFACNSAQWQARACQSTFVCQFTTYWQAGPAQQNARASPWSRCPLIVTTAAGPGCLRCQAGRSRCGSTASNSRHARGRRRSGAAGSWCRFRDPRFPSLCPFAQLARPTGRGHGIACTTRLSERDRENENFR
jgi:hypothetical protein